MSHSRSGLAWARCSSRKRAGSILGATVIVVVPFEMDLAVLSKDHAVTVAPSIDPARFLEEHLAQASPDLLWDMLTTCHQRSVVCRCGRGLRRGLPCRVG